MDRLRKAIKAAIPLLLIGLIVPGGSLVVLALLLKGGVVADMLPAKFAAVLPFLKALQIR